MDAERCLLEGALIEARRLLEEIRYLHMYISLPNIARILFENFYH